MLDRYNYRNASISFFLLSNVVIFFVLFFSLPQLGIAVLAFFIYCVINPYKLVSMSKLTDHHGHGTRVVFVFSLLKNNCFYVFLFFFWGGEGGCGCVCVCAEFEP